jgi:GTP pyrophosphokinase
VAKTSRARHKIKVFFTAQEEKRKVEKLGSEPPSSLSKGVTAPRDARSAEADSYAVGEYNLIAEGEKNVQIRLAQCCTPHPGDAIVGYITRGKGITVHREDCTNLKSIRDYGRRRISVEWEEKTRKIFTVSITSKDRLGLLHDITTAISNANANIVELHLKSSQGSTVKAVFRVQTKHEQQLKMFIKDIKALPDIISIDYR